MNGITAAPSTVAEDGGNLCEDLEGVDGGHKYAPDPEEILDTEVTYVHIGNDVICTNQKIASRPHEVYRFDWLVSRGKHPEQNYIHLLYFGKGFLVCYTVTISG